MNLFRPILLRPNIVKKLNLLFSDVETKGKIQGAERASIEKQR